MESVLQKKTSPPLKKSSGKLMLRKCKHALLILLVFSVSISFGQSERVSGTVTDAKENKPLQGVTVSIEGTKVATVTDLNGNYTIAVPSLNKNLAFTFIGMKTQVVSIAGKSIVDVKLEPDASQLSDVVVV